MQKCSRIGRCCGNHRNEMKWQQESCICALSGGCTAAGSAIAADGHSSPVCAAYERSLRRRGGGRSMAFGGSFCSCASHNCQAGRQVLRTRSQISLKLIIQDNPVEPRRAFYCSKTVQHRTVRPSTTPYTQRGDRYHLGDKNSIDSRIRD